MKVILIDILINVFILLGMWLRLHVASVLSSVYLVCRYRQVAESMDAFKLPHVSLSVFP